MIKKVLGKKTLFMVLAVLCAGGLSAQTRGLDVVARNLVGNNSFDVGKQYAVIIGINRYTEWPSLSAAVPEAKAVKRVLAERYYIDEFFELYDSDATAAKIRRLFIQTLPPKVGIRDSVLVFYAGHGQLDSSEPGERGCSRDSNRVNAYRAPATLIDGFKAACTEAGIDASAPGKGACSSRPFCL